MSDGKSPEDVYGYDPEVIEPCDSVPTGLCEECYRSPCECGPAATEDANAGDNATAAECYEGPDPDLCV